MKAGQIALFQFPQTDNPTGKLRPVLLLAKLPGHHNDWLVCMVSSQLHQHIDGFDEIIHRNDSDFASSGLKKTSVIRISRLAVVHQSILLGSIGSISEARLQRIRASLSTWLLNA